MRNAEESVPERIRIEYADQNEAFTPLLPRSGVVERGYSDREGNTDWCLVTLDEPFDFQLKIGEPFRFRLAHIAQLLIRSRWVGCTIGDKEPTPVFVLLVDDTQVPVQDPFDMALYVHIAWGTAVAEA